MQAAGPEPLVGSWNSPPLKSAKEKKSSYKEEAPVQRRSCYTAQPRPQHPHLPLTPEHGEGFSDTQGQPRARMAQTKSNAEKANYFGRKKNLTKSIIPTRNTHDSRLKEQEAINRSSHRKNCQTSARGNTTAHVSGEHVWQQSRRSRTRKTEMKGKKLQCQAESPTST